MQHSPDSLLARLPNEDKLRPSGHRSTVPGPLSVLLSEHGKEWGPFLCPTNTLRNDLKGGTPPRKEVPPGPFVDQAWPCPDGRLLASGPH